MNSTVWVLALTFALITSSEIIFVICSSREAFGKPVFSAISSKLKVRYVALKSAIFF